MTTFFEATYMKYINMTSHGLMIFSINEDRRISVLLIKKRTTYAYIDFVNARYNKYDDESLCTLLGKMTNEEKLELMSMDFNRIIYKFNFLKGGYKEADAVLSSRYERLKEAFDRNFGNDAGRAKLKMLASRVGSTDLLWEFPRGRAYRGELSMNCAMREFYEETGISSDEYFMLPGETFRLVQSDDGRDYTSHYYVGVMYQPRNVYLNLTNYHQVHEVADLRFIPLDELRHYNIFYVDKIYQYLKRLKKKYKLQKYYEDPSSL